MAPRIWLWPNLLSLDAPLVAVLWQILFIRCFQAPGPPPAKITPCVLLVCVVWLIYAADRTLDAWRGSSLRARHRFYLRHWRTLLPVWVAVFVATASLAWASLPFELFVRGAWLLAAVLVYFGIVHYSRLNWPKLNWPKEAAVAAIFGLGVSLASWARVETSYDIFTVILFACLCWINCTAISAWEENSGWPTAILAACVGLAAIAVLHRHRPILAGAEAASAIAFVMLDRSRLKLSPDALRVLADVALLSPVLFLPLAGWRF